MSTEIDERQRAWFDGQGAGTMRSLGFGPGQRIWDFGCGPGRFAVPLTEVVAPGGMVVAEDRKGESLALLHRRVEALGRLNTLHCVLAEDGAIAGASEGPYDAVLLFDVLQHVESWDELFDRAVAALNAGGAVWVYPAGGPHPGAVDMDAVRGALGGRGLRVERSHTLNLPHAGHMAEDTVYAFRRD